MAHRYTRLGLVLVLLACDLGCGGAPQPAPGAPTTTTATTPASGSTMPETPVDAKGASAPECQLYCEAPQMLPRAALEPNYTLEETNNANRVLDAMKDDLIACYKKRLRVNPNAHGFITVDILVGPDGSVRKVETTGGAVLGDETMQCLVHRVEKATFQKPHGGGTLHIRVPFSLRKIGPEEEI
jgi:hypothetical protein